MKVKKNKGAVSPILILGLVVLVLAGVILGFVLRDLGVFNTKQKESKQTLLYQGVVEKVSGTAISMSQVKEVDSPKAKKSIDPSTVYTVTTTKNTPIKLMPSYKPFGPTPDVKQKDKRFAISDIKEGNMIIVSTSTEPSLLQGYIIEASEINLTSLTQTIMGATVLQITDESILIQPISTEKRTIKLTSDTKYVRFNLTKSQPNLPPLLGKPVDISLKDLKSDMVVTIDVVGDVAQTIVDFNASAIQ